MNFVPIIILVVIIGVFFVYRRIKLYNYRKQKVFEAAKQLFIELAKEDMKHDGLAEIVVLKYYEWHQEYVYIRRKGLNPYDTIDVLHEYISRTPNPERETIPINKDLLDKLTESY